MKDFSRVKQVEIANTPIEPGTISKVLFTNTASKKVDFIVNCHFKVRADGKPLFVGNISLPPNGSLEFDVNPELSGRELPRIIASKACEGVWQGPFGMKRSVWWVSWEYGRPAHKVSFN